MERFIKQGATLPYLEVQLIENSSTDYQKFSRNIENAVVTFSMEDVNSCIPRIKCGEVQIIEDCDTCNNCPSRYRLVYKWKEKDTRKKGKFKGWFEIDFLDGCGKLIAPILDDLIIYVK